MTEPQRRGASARAADTQPLPLPWMADFLAALRTSGNVRHSCRIAGIAATTAYGARENHPEFADAWRAAVLNKAKDHLPPGFFRKVRAQFGRSLLGRQELDGELIEDIEGALWSRALLEDCRDAVATAPERRIVIGVDPPASAQGDACGIVVCAEGEDGIARVLADASVRKATPERWARAVAAAAREWRADRVVAEANNGGEMVRAVLHAADIALPVRLVHASRGKSARAEPDAPPYERGRERHVGELPQLEDELCGLMAGGTYEGPGRSPDRADALVWALSELMLGRKSEPRVTGL